MRLANKIIFEDNEFEYFNEDATYENLQIENLITVNSTLVKLQLEKYQINGKTVKKD